VDERAILPLPNSRKIHVEGSHPDIQVAMREVSQSDTADVDAPPTNTDRLSLSDFVRSSS